MLFNFYDIESLRNVFTVANYIPYENHLDIYYLIDNNREVMTGQLEEITDRIHFRNKNFAGTVSYHDLTNIVESKQLARTFGVSDVKKGFNDPQRYDSRWNNQFRLVCDTDTNYDPEKYPFLLGYNSYNYDTTMLAMFFNLWFYAGSERNALRKAPTADAMRSFNDKLFSEYKNNMPKALERKKGSFTDRHTSAACIRKNMLLSGRHVNVARLNEKQQHVGLKRLLGTLGYQILESDKLSSDKDIIKTFDELCELIAYNASDVINLACLFNHDLYQAQFSLKRELLNTYPQLVYMRKHDAHGEETYDADINPRRVREDRLTIDSSSAQFATKCLCPYDHLSDLETVSYLYPSERKAKELGIPQVNVLEETKKFFYANFEQPRLRARFDKIYNYYKSIEGKNFNASDFYKQDYPKSGDALQIQDIPKTECCLPYFNKDGSASSGFVLFSIGGIHGAEFNMDLYVHDFKKYWRLVKDLEYVKSQYPNPQSLKCAKRVLMQDGTVVEASNFLKSGKAEYKEYKEPVLFSKNDDGSTELNKRYVFTSISLTNHEDFTSYYPNMLRMMSAFWNPGLGYDRYAEIFENKQKYGKLMKDNSLSQKEREFYAVMREGTKLILNSASGAADTNNRSPIQMNNRIISMRVIGQLFSYRIGQAQTIAGAKIVSTNTDGLYSVLEKDLNNRILARESANIGVEIEPEPLFLISKDANNRMELSEDLRSVFSASGTSLACRKGPSPAKSLAHPAIIDWALSEYLVLCADENHKNIRIDQPFDYAVGESILVSAYDRFTKEDPERGRFHWLNMFQTMIASSPGTNTFIYAKDKLNGKNRENIHILPHYNRVFFMEEDTELPTVHIQASYAPTVNPKTLKKRRTQGEPDVLVDAEAEYVLNRNGIKIVNTDHETHDLSVRKVTGIDPEWNVLVMNRALDELSDDDFEQILDGICIDSYLELLGNAFTNSWMNLIPVEPIDPGYTKSKIQEVQMSLF